MEQEIEELLASGNFAAALPLAQNLYETDPSVVSRRLLLTALVSLGSFEEALPLAREIYIQAKSGEITKESMEAGNNLARLAYRSGNFPEAVEIGSEILDLFQKTFGSDHPASLQVMENLARYQMALGDLDSAFLTIQEALDLWEDQPESEALLSSLLASVEILNRITLERFNAFYGKDSEKVKEVRQRLGIS